MRDNGRQFIAILNSGENLSAQVSALHPDVIIIDLESPDRDTLEQMRSISRDNPKPVVMFSEDKDVESIKQAIAAGVSAYVVDGLSDKRIKSLMDVVIARFREYQALKDSDMNYNGTSYYTKCFGRGNWRHEIAGEHHNTDWLSLLRQHMPEDAEYL